MSSWAWVALGGNEGPDLSTVEARLSSARGALRRLATGPMMVSPLYVTPPWGGVPQQDFLNQVVGFQTALAPLAVLERLLAIEAEHGRVRQVRWGPRTLDLDLLMLGEAVIDHPRLQLPHPRLADRRFVLRPWADVAPAQVVPGHGVTVQALLARCPDGSALRPWPSAPSPG